MEAHLGKGGISVPLVAIAIPYAREGKGDCPSLDYSSLEIFKIHTHELNKYIYTFSFSLFLSLSLSVFLFYAFSLNLYFLMWMLLLVVHFSLITAFFFVGKEVHISSIFFFAGCIQSLNRLSSS